jgi:phosphopantetheine--protein transferase-like protein
MIGVDLVYIPEFQTQLDIGGPTFLDKAFSPSEITNHEISHLAGLWAAKEAVYKAAKTSPKKLSEIVISHDKTGKPRASVGNQEFEISIAHHGDYAIAVAQGISP